MQAMNLLDVQNMDHQKKVSYFADIVETKVLNELIRAQLQESNTLFDNIRNSIIMLKKAIMQTNRAA